MIHSLDCSLRSRNAMVWPMASSMNPFTFHTVFFAARLRIAQVQKIRVILVGHIRLHHLKMPGNPCTVSIVEGAYSSYTNNFE